MPPNTTCGPKPYDYRLLHAPHHLTVCLAFLPGELVQKAFFCEGHYQVRLTLWQGHQLCFFGERRLRLRATLNEQPDSSNLFFWQVHLSLTPPFSWVLECWDLERHRGWIEQDTLKELAFQPLFLSWAEKRGTFSEILSTPMVVLVSPAPVVEVVLYQAESKLPGMQRYLSLQERRFIQVRVHALDTLRLDWRSDELKAGEYLIGFYAYRGSTIVAQAFSRVVRRAFAGEKGG